MNRYIFHIDVNAAYLSWSAAYRLQQGDAVDLRFIPSVVGGNEKSRHGIVLAKSTPAKQYGIHTGEPLLAARQKCPNLMVVPPDYNLYMKASQAMIDIIQRYSPLVQQFSVDECFVDFFQIGPDKKDPVLLAHTIKDAISDELGFTVNIGVSHNKILAKMASDFKKPNLVHTLFSHELEEKLWPLPVSDLFMVGRQTSKKLYYLGITTIGELAKADTDMLYGHFKSFAHLIQSYANGVDPSPVRKNNHPLVKGMGNSTTVKFDVLEATTAYQVLLSLAESVGMRLRAAGFCAGLIAVSITSATFGHKSHQYKLSVAMNSTSYIHQVARRLFDELWDGTPIRKLGLRASDLHTNDYVQLSFLEDYDFSRDRLLDLAVDRIRGRYGLTSIQRASFLHSGLNPVTGGIGVEDYPVMTSIL
jgi:DNA polymerase-4